MYKTHKIITLTTENNGVLSRSVVDDKLEIGKPCNNQWCNQHLYILSDDEIKEGDWYVNGNIEKENHHIDKCTIDNIEWLGEIKKIMDNPNFPKNVITKKIIATTNKSLNLPLIPDSFIKEYCYKGGIDEVLIECELVQHFCHDCTEVEIIRGKIDCGRGCKHNHSTYFKPYYIPKVNSNNFISIKFIKDSWNREEVVNILESFNIYRSTIKFMTKEDFNEWIEYHLK